MEDQFIRTRMLLGDAAMERLQHSHVAVFGLGGVGSWCAEALCRSGVGELTLIDLDDLSVSNINRQAFALHSTVGMKKAEAAALRLADISPTCQLHPMAARYEAQTREEFFQHSYDCIVDAIDLVSCKLDLAETALRLQIPLIAALGTGNKLDPTLLQVTDISKTYGCPLARVMRKELRRRGVQHLKVVYSTEEPRSPIRPAQAEAPAGSETRPGTSARRDTPGSISFVPAAAGLVLASAVVRDLGQF